mmetsp:Transcript_24010/g.56671  ORF Transcript_24010/g.56671 Transcript_24010/m.56671 type:complete len:432 (+) Transcript_24010:33-1328(+)
MVSVMGVYTRIRFGFSRQTRSAGPPFRSRIASRGRSAASELRAGSRIDRGVAASLRSRDVGRDVFRRRDRIDVVFFVFGVRDVPEDVVDVHPELGKGDGLRARVHRFVIRKVLVPEGLVGPPWDAHVTERGAGVLLHEAHAPVGKAPGAVGGSGRTVDVSEPHPLEREAVDVRWFFFLRVVVVDLEDEGSGGMAGLARLGKKPEEGVPPLVRTVPVRHVEEIHRNGVHEHRVLQGPDIPRVPEPLGHAARSQAVHFLLRVGGGDVPGHDLQDEGRLDVEVQERRVVHRAGPEKPGVRHQVVVVGSLPQVVDVVVRVGAEHPVVVVVGTTARIPVRLRGQDASARRVKVGGVVDVRPVRRIDVGLDRRIGLGIPEELFRRDFFVDVVSGAEDHGVNALQKEIVVGLVVVCFGYVPFDLGRKFHASYSQLVAL